MSADQYSDRFDLLRGSAQPSDLHAAQRSALERMLEASPDWTVRAIELRVSFSLGQPRVQPASVMCVSGPRVVRFDIEDDGEILGFSVSVGRALPLGGSR